MGSIHKLNLKMLTYISQLPDQRSICSVLRWKTDSINTALYHILPEISSAHIYTHRAGNRCSSTRKRYQNICRPRWLAPIGRLCKQIALPLKHNDRASHQVGFLINYKKSQFNPTQYPEFLGARLDLPCHLAQPLAPTQDTQIIQVGSSIPCKPKQ